MATMRNYILCPRDIGYVQYVLEQYTFRKKKKMTVVYIYICLNVSLWTGIMGFVNCSHKKHHL